MTSIKAPERLRFAAVAVDVVVFGIRDGELCVLLEIVNRPPHYSKIEAFIGGLIEIDETAEDAVVRHLRDKAGLRDVYTEQLFTFSKLDRDKRNRVISVGYIGFVPPVRVEANPSATTQWCPAKKLSALAYDHNEMFRMALQRFRGKLSYTTIAQFIVSKEFTLSELQTVYELVYDRPLDKRNFRKKILALDVVKETGNMQEGVKNRPAALYIFKTKELTELPVLF